MGWDGVCTTMIELNTSVESIQDTPIHRVSHEDFVLIEVRDS